ncbi:integral membrane protein MviN [Synechococcus sp. PCC 7335]|nr:integral membrane protein MviN [Synechococcus sp. PCC 7335]
MGKKSLAGIAGIVAAATLLSKAFGYLRQASILAAFGTGPVTDANAAAYALPAFMLVLLGGVNGPFHSAIISAIARKKREEVAPIVETITTIVGIVLAGVTVAIILFAPAVIDLFAPGFGETDVGLLVTRPIAIAMLRVMAPIAVFAGFIGIGFGSLNADDQYWLPSVSPLLSSVTVVLGLLILRLVLGEQISDPSYFMTGGIVVAGGTLTGAMLQWLVQVPALAKSGLGRLRLRFDIHNPGVRDVLKVLVPATLSSGTLQINALTDLRFATYIPQAPAALESASLLVLAPLGIISNVVLVPFFPVFSRLAEPALWPDLKLRIRQSLMLVALTMMPISALIITLARPIVTVAYRYGAFDEDSVEIVSSLLIAYGIGMFVYLARDVMVRVFYALGDGQTPFKISLVNIVINFALDYVFLKLMGAPGLVIATVGVNLVSLIAMTILLARKIGGLPLIEWTGAITTVFAVSMVSGLSCWLTLGGLASVLGSEGFVTNLVQVCVAGAVGSTTFVLIAVVLKIPEAELLIQQVRQRFSR